MADSAPPEEVNEILVEMSGSDAFFGAVREYADKLLGTSGPGLSMAQQALKSYSDGPLSEHVRKRGVILAD